MEAIKNKPETRKSAQRRHSTSILDSLPISMKKEHQIGAALSCTDIRTLKPKSRSSLVGFSPTLALLKSFGRANIRQCLSFIAYVLRLLQSDTHPQPETSRNGIYTWHALSEEINLLEYILQ